MYDYRKASSQDPDSLLQQYCDSLNSHSPDRKAKPLGGSAEGAWTGSNSSVSVNLDLRAKSASYTVRAQIHCSASYLDLEQAEEFHKNYAKALKAMEDLRKL